MGQPSLIQKATPNTNEVLKPLDTEQVQAHRDRSASGSGIYYGKLQDGTEEIIGGPGAPAPSGPGLYIFKQALTAAQIKTANSSPVPITDLPSPGLGYAWQIISASEKFVFGTTQFDGVQLHLAITASDYDNRQIEDLAIVKGSSSCHNIIQPIYTAQPIINIVENSQMYIISNVDSTLGDSTTTIYGVAQKIKL